MVLQLIQHFKSYNFFKVAFKIQLQLFCMCIIISSFLDLTCNSLHLMNSKYYVSVLIFGYSKNVTWYVREKKPTKSNTGWSCNSCLLMNTEKLYAIFYTNLLRKILFEHT